MTKIEKARIVAQFRYNLPDVPHESSAPIPVAGLIHRVAQQSASNVEAAYRRALTATSTLGQHSRSRRDR